MLKDLQIKAAKPREKPYKLSDGNCLHVRVMPSGAKLFQVRYFIAGEERTFSIGQYGSDGGGKTLLEARADRDEALRLVREGKDPTTDRRVRRATKVVEYETHFEATALEWHANWKTGYSEKHTAKVLMRMKTDIFPALGKLPLTAITPNILFSEVMEPIQARGAHDWARKARQLVSAVYEFAQASHSVPEGYNPAPERLVRRLKAKPELVHQPALVTLPEVRKMLAEVESLRAKPVTRLALRFLAMTALRTSEMRQTTWDMFETSEDGSVVLHLPRRVMKMNRPFDIKLSTKCVEVLDALRTLTGRGTYLFPSDRTIGRPISENAVLFLLQRAGFKDRHTGHGFRASFSTIMNERHPKLSEILDFALAHIPRNVVQRAYNRAAYLETRFQLQEEYADLVFGGLAPAEALLIGPRH